MACNNFSSGLPEEIIFLTSLTTLNVKDCQLKCLPQSITQLRNLQALNISNNEFSEGSLDNIFTSSLTLLKELNLQHCNLTTLPRSLGELKNLKVLTISGNDFAECLPEDIFMSYMMTSLKELNAECCRLRSLPQKITGLENLQILNISDNDFSSGLPDDIFASSLATLRELNMQNCELKVLPQSMQNLQQLTHLNMSDNKFTSLPSVVCALSSLETLQVSGRAFISLNPKVLRLTNLQRISVCSSLPKMESPPPQIVSRGVDAVMQYYKDLEKGKGRNLPMVTIAVIGKSFAGKTSIIKTLQSANKERVLTNRDPNADVDETTKVFKVEEIEVNDTMLRLIDMGGQEAYHITYQLTLKDNCIPVVVVSMEQYHAISKVSGNREAVRRCAFDYMSHLYLANPDLGSPKLVFTHQDKFSEEKSDELKVEFLQTCRELCQDMVQEDKMLGGQFCKIKLFSDSTQDIFLPHDIYVIGKDSRFTVFENFKMNLFDSCNQFKKQLPEIWEKVNDGVLSLPSVYNTFNQIFTTLYRKDHTISRKQISVILQYMHDSGKILWYKNIPSLEGYYFHKISEVTKLLGVFFHHDADQEWKRRLEEFRPYFGLGSVWVDREHFEGFVNKFRDTGVMDQELLFYLIKKETAFTSEQDLKIAIILMTTFRLLHGPIKNDSIGMSFIIPYFATGRSHMHDGSSVLTEALTFQVDILFKGLSLPHYVYHQMIVRFFEMFPTTLASKVVVRNGAKLYDNGFEMKLVHDYKSRKVSIYVSSDAENVCEMWNKLINITNNTLRQVKEVWSASRHVTVSYCAHCLLRQNISPGKIIDPDWSIYCQYSQQRAPTLTTTSSTFICNEEQTYAIFQYPCVSPSMPQKKSGRFLRSLYSKLQRPSAKDVAPPDVEIAPFKETVEELRAHGKKVIANVERAELAIKSPVAAASCEDELSDFSDDDEDIYPDEEAHCLASLNNRAKPVTNSKIEDLFTDTNKAFKMTRKRGRALIINNKDFEDRQDICREGSDVDVQNMVDMLKQFKFEVAVKRNLTAEGMLSIIKIEVEHQSHEDMGCHVLVIMSHGTADNRIFGTDMKLVNLTHVYDLLSSINFPGMSGKPKVVIVEACSGDRIDMGEKGIHPHKKDVEAVQQVKYETVTPPFSQVGQRQEAKSMSSLNYDDLLVIKASVESFISKRHPVYGSLMIRALVSTMYKHACHRDLYEIFKQVQRLVRNICIKKKLDDGQIALVWDTLTHSRKLYLFPGFNGPKTGGDS